MIFVFLGSFSFVLMVLYDLNQLRRNKNSFLNSFFILGFCILFICSVLLLSDLFNRDITFINITGFVAGLIFLTVMIYALFFNLPFKKTYNHSKSKNDIKNQTITTGLYALCRHPGVLAFILCYLSFYIATQTKAMLYAWLIWSALDIVHVAIQDIYIFPKTLSGYDEYKKSTPFLIPSLNSVRRFLGK